IDQKPIGRTPRSNPATYTKVFDAIRDVFARTPEARAYGYEPGRFSFNVKGGRCEACEGDGLKVVEMHFLADVYVPCEVCHGKRFNDATLRVTFKGKNIAEVLDMSVREAMEHFSVLKCADWIIDVGPEGGDNGGKLVATGTPEQVAQVKASYTGEYLGKVLSKARVAS